MTSPEPQVIYGDIVIEHERIVSVGEPYCPEEDDRIIDGSSSVVLPGLVNAHTHLAMTLLRNCADDMDLFTWLNDHIWPREAKLAPSDILTGSCLGLLEMIRSGVTTFSDMYFSQEQTILAVLQSGIGAHIGATIIGDEAETERRIPILKELFSSWNGAEGGRIIVDTAPHAIYTCSTGALKMARDLAESFNTSLHIHVSESAKENRDSLEAHGITPIEYLDSIGFFSVPTYAAHCVYLSDEDIETCSRRDVRIVHNPTSNLKLGNGFAPAAAYLRKGITVGLGTDGASSNNNLNMFEEMHIASLVHKAVEKDPRIMSAYEVLRMATMGGARALGRDNDIGSLKAGKRADIILAGTDAPHLVPLNNPISAMVYSAQASDIHMVISSGKIIMENREILTLDEQQILSDARVCAQKLV